jgi:two-component system cell cycle response regulator
LVANIDAVVATARREHPDVILVVGRLSNDEALTLPPRLADIAGAADIPICLATVTHSPEQAARAYAAGIDDVLPPPLDDDKLLAHLRPLVRLAIMHAELHVRAGTAGRFGLDVRDVVSRSAADAGYPLLVIGPGGRQLEQPLRGARFTFADDPIAADDVLGTQNFDAALLVPDAEPAAYLDLCVQMRNNPRLFNLPVLFVCDPGQIDEAVAYRRGASGVFVRPLDAAELRSAVLSVVRRQRLRWAIREALGKTLQDATRDMATGLNDPAFLEAYLADRVKPIEKAIRDLTASVYSRPFLDAYLADRVRFAAKHGRHLSIMFFRLPDLAGLCESFGDQAAEHLRLQVAQWITGLLRGEDVTARYAADEFCVVLPDTPRDEAEIVMHRIAGVLAYTDFAVLGVYQPVKAWVRVGCADLEPNESAERLVERARQDVL